MLLNPLIGRSPDSLEGYLNYLQYSPGMDIGGKYLMLQRVKDTIDFIREDKKTDISTQAAIKGILPPIAGLVSSVAVAGVSLLAVGRTRLKPKGLWGQ